MENLRIVYPHPDGSICVGVLNADCGLSADEIAQQVVPAGTPYRIIHKDELPGDLAYSPAWTADFAASQEDFKVTLDPVKKAEIDKQGLLAALEDWFVEVTGPGFKTPDGWRIGMSQADVSLLTGNYVLAKEAASMGLPLPAIVDLDGASHTFDSIEDLTALMLSYGQARAAISAEYAAKKKAILDHAQP